MNPSSDANELREILSKIDRSKTMTQSEKVLRVAFRYYLQNSRALTHGTWDNRCAKVCAKSAFPKIVTSLVNEGYVIWKKSSDGRTIHYFLTESGMDKARDLHHNGF